MSRPGFHHSGGGSSDNYRVGRRIRVPEVRVIGADGQQVGVMPTAEALRLAEEQGLELVEVNPRSAPPVCRIMDFGKFKYETSKKEKASKKHQSTVVVKEIKLRPKTDDHDLDFKVKHIRRFLAEGNKCRLVIAFRGREIVHPETGQAMLDEVMRMVGDAAMIESKPMMEGRRMVLVIAPKAGVIRRDLGPGAGPAPGGPVTGPTGVSPRPTSAPMGPTTPRPPAPAGQPAPAARPQPPAGPAGQPAPAARPQAPAGQPAPAARPQTPTPVGPGGPPPASKA